MTIGPAGTVNTNVPPQNYGGVSQEQVEDFKEAVSHSTTSSNASGMQSSKGEHTSEHSQDTSKSLPFVLATRPPINLGSPIGKQGAPLYDTQGKGSKAGSETGSIRTILTRAKMQRSRCASRTTINQTRGRARRAAARGAPGTAQAARAVRAAQAVRAARAGTALVDRPV